MLISTLSFSLMNFGVKYLSYLNSFQLIFFRSIGTFLICSILIQYKKISYFGNNKKILLARGILGFIAMSLFFLALKFLNLGTAVALRYIAPIYATLFALFILKEPVEKKQWIYFIVAYAGVLILQGFDSSMSTLGLILIMIGAMFSGLVFMIIRYIKQTENSLVIVNYFMGISLIISGIISIFYWIPPLKEHWILLIALGVLGFFGQFFMTKSLQMATAIYVSPMKYIEVIFSLILGVTFFNEMYTLESLLGLALILIGLIANLFVKKRL